MSVKTEATLLARLLALMLFLVSLPSNAQDSVADEAESPDSSRSGTPQLFFDSRTWKFDKEGKIQVFEGNVVAVAAGTILTADSIELDRGAGVLRARGHILILAKKQVFSGEDLYYNLDNGDFKMTAATLVTDDERKTEEVYQQVLGFGDSEVAFETQRKQRLEELDGEKHVLKDAFRRESSLSPQLEKTYIDRYAVILEREKLIHSQEPQSLAKLSSERRTAFKKRRIYWENNKALTDRLAGGRTPVGYFRISGDEIQRVNENDMSAQKAFWTACRCDDHDEAVPWGFQADTIKAQNGGYVDMTNAVLEIKGVPILYLPYLKLPLKSVRQSGFLLPYVLYDEKSGNIFSQPVYFAFDKSSDATFNTDFIQKRGTRLGVEYRKKFRNTSGFTLQVEGIRDRLWLEDRVRRRDLLRVYDEGLTEAARRHGEGIVLGDGEVATVRTPEWWQQDGIRKDPALGNCASDTTTVEDQEGCRRGLQKHMAVPLNDWRGRFGLRGGVFFAPRLQVATESEFLSDHRYADDLFYARDLAEILSSTDRAQSFSKSKISSHLDGKDLYLGIGSNLGDNMFMEGRYAGEQIPLTLHAQSRMFSLTRRNFLFPIYGQLDGENQLIDLNEAKDSADFKQQTGELSLGSGSWRRGRLRLMAPLVQDSAVAISQFTDLEGRYVEHRGLAEGTSSIQTWRAGLKFSMPLEGSLDLGQGWDESNSNGNRYLRHYMNWDLIFSARPVVARKGPYGQINNFEPSAPGYDPKNLSTLSYYAGDRILTIGKEPDGNFVSYEDAMIPHRRVILGTQHEWGFLNRQWAVIPGASSNQGEDKTGGTSIQERAKQELRAALNRPIADDRELLDDAGTWKVDRYRAVETGLSWPLAVEANISYDFDLQDLRERQKEKTPEILEKNAEFERMAVDALASDPSDSRRIAEGYRNQKEAIILPEPWSSLETIATLNYDDWRLASKSHYDFYRKKSDDADVTLTAPPFWSSRLGIGFMIGNTSKVSKGNLVDVIERTRSVALDTSISSQITGRVALADRFTDDPDSDSENGSVASERSKSERIGRYFSSTYQSEFGLAYISKSECWGLDFSRIKKFPLDEAQASYVLRVNILFMGQSRPAGDNLSPGVLREFKVGPYRDTH